MRIIRIVCSILILAFFITAAYAAEATFTASSLTAKDVDCKKCHTGTPHFIHAQKPVECVNCHGDKSSVSIPQCTKCHDGLIHKVHAGKVSTQSCEYCHKNIGDVHNNLMKDAVCSHCHQDLIVVHGKESACTKCHKSPPDIVKPIKSEGMVLICQDCHAKSSVATIHGAVDDKKGCYECHKGTSTAQGSEIPHVIHAGKIDCQGCHQESGKVVVPQCTRCHDIDKIHAFSKIGKLTTQSGLRCTACHQAEAKLSGTQNSSPKPAETASVVQTVSTPAETIPAAGAPEAVETPGFTATFAIGIFVALYLSGRAV